MLCKQKCPCFFCFLFLFLFFVFCLFSFFFSFCVFFLAIICSFRHIWDAESQSNWSRNVGNVIYLLDDTICQSLWFISGS